MKNYEIYNSTQAIVKLLQQDLPIKTAFKLKKIKKALEPILGVIEETKKEIESKNVSDKPVLDKDGKAVEGAFFLTNEGIKARNEFMLLESELIIEKLEEADLSDLDVKISVADLESLEWLIK